MKIVIIKYNAGNIRSVDFALQRMGIKAEITDDKNEIRKADKVIFPGVGAAGNTMEYLIANKMDKLSENETESIQSQIKNLTLLSAKSGIGVEALKNQLLSFVNTGALRNNDTIVTNSRHYDSLLMAFEAVHKVKDGLESGLSGDLLAIDIRQALYYFGEITGEITNDDLLGNIFSNFCIGK